MVKKMKKIKEKKEFILSVCLVTRVAWHQF